MLLAKGIARSRGSIADLDTLLLNISRKGGVEGERIVGVDRRRSVVGARRKFCREAVKKLGYSGAEVARFLGVTTSLVSEKRDLKVHDFHYVPLKVCVEILAMAADAGAIPVNKNVIAVAGTRWGADSAFVIKPAHTTDIWDIRIVEILCKPGGNVF